MALSSGKYDGDFLISEDPGTRSRDSITVLSGQNLQAGHLIGKVTSSGKYIEWNPANSDGSQTVAGISWANVNATTGDVTASIIHRDAEVNASYLIYFTGASSGNIATAATQLAALGIIVRQAL